MSKEIKGMLIADIQQRIGDTKDFLVIDSSRMDAITSNRFRLGLQDANVQALTVKNSLARVALSQSGVEGVDDLFAGPSTLVWGGEDVVALSKEIAKWAKEVDELEIRGGTVEGTALDAAEVDALSKSPGRLELIGEVVGLMLSPARQIAGALLGPARTVAGQVKQVSEGDE